MPHPASSPAWSPSRRPAPRSRPIGAIIVGVLAGVVCALAIGLKYKFGYDDSLDVVGVHLVGGLWGTLAVGFLAHRGRSGWTSNGLFYGGGVDQLWRQAVGAFAVLLYSLDLTLVIGFVLHKTIGFRVSEEEERAGVDEVGARGDRLRSRQLGAGIARRVVRRLSASADRGRDSNHDQEVTA